MTRQPPFENIAIVGVGLLGGSLGLALKKRYPKFHIKGVGRNEQKLELALRLGALDSFELESETALRGQNLVFLATPVQSILSMLDTIGSMLDPGTVLTDVGSTKRLICRKAWHRLPSQVEFIGGHPLAGKEVRGVENSSAALFREAPYVLCPHPGGRTANLANLMQVVEGLGAHPTVLLPEEHDQTVTWTSHLPQLLATGLAAVLIEQETPDFRLTRISGAGLRDMVRLSGSDYGIWEGILTTNDDNIVLAVEAMIRQLERMKNSLGEGRLSHEFDRAAQFYASFQENHQVKGT